ncbi:MAG: DUF4403 family protein [Chitinophagaceae bacterium]
MRKTFILTLIGLTLVFAGIAQSTASSTLMVPVTINLKPLYALAEKSVDSFYTSKGYPDAWQQEECEVRYQYTFRRGPLQISANGNQFQFGFLGFIKVIGALRACLNGKPITGWTPSCRCGFEEGEIPIRVQFTGQLSLLSSYQLNLKLQMQEPVSQGKCEVCFWKQDITAKVVKGIKQELILAKKEINKIYSLINFRPQFDSIWQLLQAPYSFSEMGYFYLRPESIHVNQFKAQEDILYLQVGLSANPIVTLYNETLPAKTLPPIKPSSFAPGFSIELEARLQYDSLTSILQRKINGHPLVLKKGIVQKKFVIDSIFLQDSYSSHCLLKVHFSGADRGIAYIRAKPIYDSASQEIKLNPADITLHSNNKLIDLTDKLFQEKLKKEIIQKSTFLLTDYFNIARGKLENEMNREWVKGIKGEGKVREMHLKRVETGTSFLRISLITKGLLSVKISEASLSL